MDWTIKTAEAEPVEVEASHGGVETVKTLQGIYYAGTGLPEEMLEIEKHIRELIDAGYTYMFIERLLMSYGYQYKMVRHMFELLTGMCATDAVNYKWQYSPGNIPGLTLGWGIAKNGKSAYFIMPIGNWYCIFHQIDDQHREEESKHLLLTEAVEALGKLVKKVERWDPPIKEDKKSKIDKTQLYKQPWLFMNASMRKLDGHLRTVQSEPDRATIIKQAYVSGEINDVQRKALMFRYADEDVAAEVAKEVVDTASDKVKSKPLAQEFAPQTPSDKFHEVSVSQMQEAPVDIVSQIMGQIHEINSNLQGYDILFKELNLKLLTPAGTASADIDEKDIMNASAQATVLVLVKDKSSGDIKWGGMLFDAIKGDVSSDGTIYDVTDPQNKNYAPTDETLNAMFKKGPKGAPLLARK